MSLSAAIVSQFLTKVLALLIRRPAVNFIDGNGTGSELRQMLATLLFTRRDSDR